MTYQQLEEVRNQMQDCGSCDLCRQRTQIVFGSGPADPLVMIIGEAPGEEEDKQGKPFVGKAGEKLDKMLKYVGLERDNDVYITNAVLCRPPNNRNPRSDELEACKYRLNLQIQLLQPELIIVLGRIAMQQLSGQPVKGALSQFFPDNIKGEWLNYKVKNHQAKVLVTYHPSYHLRAPEHAYKVTLPHWTQVKKWVKEYERS